jgi:hypothetical protein
MSAQRQDSTLEQLRTVIDLANKAGCYDAADWIKERLGPSSSRLLQMLNSGKPND